MFRSRTLEDLFGRAIANRDRVTRSRGIVRRRRSALACTWVFWLIPLLAAGQGAAALTGMVVDDSGGAIVSAQVALLGSDGTVRQTTRTDASGRFSRRPPTPGRYVMAVEQRLFQPTRVEIEWTRGATPPEPRVVLKGRGLPESVNVLTAAEQPRAGSLALGQPASVRGPGAAVGVRSKPGGSLPRTPDGHPDLQGTWDNGMVTPLERPREFASQGFFTEEEAAEYLKHGLDRFRAARGEIEFQTNGEIAEIWSAPGRVGPNRRTSIIVDPPDGKLPPLTPEAQRRIAVRLEARKQHPFDNPEDLTLGERCIMWGAGPPMLPTPQNSMLQIVQTSGHVLILNEMIHDFRDVPLDGRPHLPPEIRQLKGDPRGRWDGDTLVVDTANFTDKGGVGGTTAARHVVERFTLTDADTIRYQFTVDDATALTRPWSGELFLKRTEDRIFEYACHEANYSMSMILRGARAQEKP